MNIIDKKGKLFGLINIIDLLIIVVLVFAIVFAAKRYFIKPDESKMMRKANLTFEIQDVRDITLKSLHEGDDLFWTDRSVPIGKITKLETISHQEALNKDGDGVFRPVPGKYDVAITVEATLKDDANAYWAMGEQVRAGVKYSIKTKYISMESFLIGLDVDEE